MTAVRSPGAHQTYAASMFLVRMRVRLLAVWRGSSTEVELISPREFRHPAPGPSAPTAGIEAVRSTEPSRYATINEVPLSLCLTPGPQGHMSAAEVQV